jgi:Na+/H+-dicarboxylate symporter
MKKKVSPWWVFLAIALGMIVGSLTGTQAGLFGISFYSIYDLCGTLFIKSLTLVVVPLVAASIITGIARIGGEKSFGRLGLKTFAFYITTTLLAVLVGLLFVNLIKPGHETSLTSIVSEKVQQFSKMQEQITSGKLNSFSDLLLQIVPSNVLDAMAKGHMLAIIFFSILFGFAISKVEREPGTVLAHFWQGIFQAMIKITEMIMKILPLGVFFLVAKVFATTGFESLKSLLLFSITAILALAFFTFVAMPLLLKFIGKVNPINHFRAMAPALVTAFSTSSSSATLPITLECVEKRAGVSNRVSSLVIPLGLSLNLSGSALYECVAAMFVAQVYGIDLSFTTQFMVLFLALITSLGVAGIPAGSLVAVIVILKAIGLPEEGISLFIAVDRLLDMCRTTVNVFSDSCCAVLVARTEGEKNVLTKTNF